MDLGEDWARLWRELGEIADRPLRKAFLQAGDEDETDKYPILAREIQRLVGRDRWRRSPGQAATLVIRVAIDDLPDGLSGRNPELQHQEDGNNSWKGKPERLIAEFLYGYRDDELPARELDDGTRAPHTYEGSYLPKALALLGYDKRNPNTRRALRVIREDMAAAILALDPDDPRLALSVVSAHAAPDRTRSHVPSLAARLAHEPTYVPRRQYHLKFNQLLDEGHRVIILSGDQGNGKSRLALELVAEHLPPDEPLPYIFGESPATISRDVRALLSMDGTEVSTVDMDELAIHFASLVSSAHAPAWMVIDNLGDQSHLRQLLPSLQRSMIVVTASIRVPGYENSTIDVGSMEPDEAVALACGTLGRQRDDQIDALCGWLEYRPLPIVQVCGAVIADEQLRVEDFIEDFKRNPAAVLNAPTAAVGVTLTALYTKVLRALSEKRPEAARLFELIAFVDSEYIPRNLLYTALTDVIPSIDRTSFQAAVLELEARYLIRRLGGALESRWLTQDIVRHLLAADAKRLCRVLYRAAEPLIRSEVMGQPLSEQSLLLLPHLAQIIDGLGDMSELVNVDHFLASFCRGMRQVGGDAFDLAMSLLLDTGCYEVRWADENYVISQEEKIAYIRRMPELYWELLLQLPDWSLDDDLPISPEEYANALDEYYHSLDRGEDLPPGFVVQYSIAYAEALASSGRREVALEFLLEKEGAVRSHLTYGAEYADYLVVLGEIASSLGRWSGASEVLSDALGQYQREVDFVKKARGVTRAIAALVENSFMGNISKDKLRSWMNTIYELPNGAPVLHDNVSLARWEWLISLPYVDATIKWLLDHAAEEQLSDSSLAELQPIIDRFFTRWGLTYSLLQLSNSNRILDQTAYDASVMVEVVLLLCEIAGRDALPQPPELSIVSELLHRDRSRFMSFLAWAKLAPFEAILLGGVDRLTQVQGDYWARVAWDAVFLDENPYCYCLTLELCYVLGVMTDWNRTDAIRDALLLTYHEIDRVDRAKVLGSFQGSWERLSDSSQEPDGIRRWRNRLIRSLLLMLR